MHPTMLARVIELVLGGFGGSFLLTCELLHSAHIAGD